MKGVNGMIYKDDLNLKKLLAKAIRTKSAMLCLEINLLK